METVADFMFLGSRITADTDCGHEIRRHLLLGIKAVTHLGSMRKSRDINLPTKARIVKAVVSPVVMYKYESWTITKADHQRIDALKLWCWIKLLRVPWIARRSNPSILKEINPEYSLEGQVPKLKLQRFGHLMWRADSLQKTLMLGKTEAGGEGATEDEMVGWHHRLKGHEFEQMPGDRRGQRSLACCSPRGCKELDVTEGLNNRLLHGWVLCPGFIYPSTDKLMGYIHSGKYSYTHKILIHIIFLDKTFHSTEIIS